MGINNTQQNRLHLFTKGLPQYEEKIIEATAKFSHSRALPIYLVDESKAQSAEIIVIDGNNSHSRTWAEDNQLWLRQKTVIWVDKQLQPFGYIGLKRPVLWVNLPIILTRTLDDIETLKATRSATPNTIHPHSQANTNIKAHILVCDDSEVVRSHLTTLLHQRGYTTTTVDNGEAAIEVVQNQSFDCVLMDVLMPGIDGYRACRSILRQNLGKHSTPVIMLTSKTSPFDKIRGKMSGCSAYLTKPVSISDLLKTIERYSKKK